MHCPCSVIGSSRTSWYKLEIPQVDFLCCTLSRHSPCCMPKSVHRTLPVWRQATSSMRTHTLHLETQAGVAMHVQYVLCEVWQISVRDICWGADTSISIDSCALHCRDWKGRRKYIWWEVWGWDWPHITSYRSWHSQYGQCWCQHKWQPGRASSCGHMQQSRLVQNVVEGSWLFTGTLHITADITLHCCSAWQANNLLSVVTAVFYNTGSYTMAWWKAYHLWPCVLRHGSHQEAGECSNRCSWQANNWSPDTESYSPIARYAGHHWTSCSVHTHKPIAFVGTRSLFVCHDSRCMLACRGFTKACSRNNGSKCCPWHLASSFALFC